jgi:hypothetical protein
MSREHLLGLLWGPERIHTSTSHSPTRPPSVVANASTGMTGVSVIFNLRTADNDARN